MWITQFRVEFFSTLLLHGSYIYIYDFILKLLQYYLTTPIHMMKETFLII